MTQYYYSQMSGAELDAALEQVSQAAQAAASAQESASQAQSSARQAELSQEAAKAYAESSQGYSREESDNRFAPIVVPTLSGTVLSLKDAADLPIVSAKVYGMTYMNGTPDPEAPVALSQSWEDEPLELILTGKNRILEKNYDSQTIWGITRTRTADGGWHYTGTATGDVLFTDDFLGVIGENMILTGCPAGGSSEGYMMYYQEGVNYIDYGSGVTFTPQTWGILQVYTRIAAGATVDVTFYPMVRAADTDGAFVPPQAQILALPVEGGLGGIPVANSSHRFQYIDGQGCKWLADTLEVQLGQCCRRLKKVVFDGSEAWTRTDGTFAIQGLDLITGSQAPDDGTQCYFLCSHFRAIPLCSDEGRTTHGTAYATAEGSLRFVCKTIGDLESWKTFLAQEAEKGTPLTVIYASKTEALELLDPQVPAAFGKMIPCPGAALANSLEGEMTASYRADTQRYIHRQLAALTAAL